MQTNPNQPGFRPADPAPGSEEFVDRSAPHASSAPQVPADQALHPRYPAPSGPDQNAGVTPNPAPDEFQPVEPTPEEYVALAKERYRHTFTPEAAKAFIAFDDASPDIQAAEFFRYRDEEIDEYGYF